jgi:hypothetical protein
MIDMNYITKVNWGSPSNFWLTELHLKNIPSSDKFNQDCILTSRTYNSGFINTALLSISTPNVSSQPIEEWIGGSWHYTNGRPELRQIDITFRDTADGLLWKNFVYLYDFLANEYPNNAMWNLSLASIALEAFNRIDASGNFLGTLIDTDTAILTQVGQLQFSKDQADSFTTFTVTFKYYNHKRHLESDALTDNKKALLSGLKRG